MQGKKMHGRLERTSEIAMHTTVYALRPDVQAVVHTHPPVSTGFAVAGKPLNLALLPEVVIGLGCVPLAEYGLPGTSELTDSLLPYIPNYDALLMANHGVVCYADAVLKAFYKMETVEHFARITLVAEMLGGPKVLPRFEVDKLIDSRGRYGVSSRAAMEPGCPVVAEDLAPGGYGNSRSERFSVTREELIALVDEAIKARS
jgi:L-fuculose-phosphate aldolase